MPKSFDSAHREDAGAAMHNQWECTLTALPSQMLSKNVPVLSPWPDFCWPLPAEVAESRDLGDNARETGHLPAGWLVVTIRQQIEGLLCCPALASA